MGVRISACSPILMIRILKIFVDERLVPSKAGPQQKTKKMYSDLAKVAIVRNQT